MSTRQMIDPELTAALAALPRLDFAAADIVTMRAGLAAARGGAPVVDVPEVTSREIFAPGAAGAPMVRIVAHQPRGGARILPGILHIHGGGYVLGAANLADLPTRLLARDLGCAVFSVDYRLAPETPHPGPVEDCFAALGHLAAHAPALGLDAARLGVMGESAGGGLAAALALLARDRGGPPLAFQHLIYPMLDDRTGSTAEPHPYIGQHVWTAADNRFGWAALLGEPPGGPDVSPYAAPARAQDLANLPPAYLAVGALDLFLEENLDYARRLTRAGTPVEFHLYPGAFHGFQLAGAARVTRAANRDSQEALRRALWG